MKYMIGVDEEELDEMVRETLEQSYYTHKKFMNDTKEDKKLLKALRLAHNYYAVPDKHIKKGQDNEM